MYVCVSSYDFVSSCLGRGKSPNPDCVSYGSIVFGVLSNLCSARLTAINEKVVIVSTSGSKRFLHRYQARIDTIKDVLVTSSDDLRREVMRQAACNIMSAFKDLATVLAGGIADDAKQALKDKFNALPASFPSAADLQLMVFAGECVAKTHDAWQALVLDELKIFQASLPALLDKDIDIVSPNIHQLCAFFQKDASQLAQLNTDGFRTEV